MIQATDFLQQTKQLGFSLFTGVPCSYLKPFINYTIDAPELDYIGATNEGDAVAIASGAELAGRRSVVMFQNSGFGNAVNPLTSLNAIFRIPVLVIVTWRGEPGGEPDEPQHELMGQITTELFEVMRLPYALFPQTEAEIGPVLNRAVTEMEHTGLPFGLIMKQSSVASHPLQTSLQPKPLAQVISTSSWPEKLPMRSEVLRTVQNMTRSTDAVIATTGYMGRALYALEDRPNQLYLVGSMGCAASLGLGLALAQPQRRVIVLDGDGAALMRLGALATIGYERPPNLIHILLDNEMHESTGGQSTVSHSVDLAAVAQACGYPRVVRAGSLDDVAAMLSEGGEELSFIHVKTRPDEVSKLPRPTMKPWQVAERFRAWLRETSVV
jgi:phosphonopyruvate decarboxylase